MNERHALFVKKPGDFGLHSKALWITLSLPRMITISSIPMPIINISKQFNGTFQHGGNYMEEADSADCYLPHKRR